MAQELQHCLEGLTTSWENHRISWKKYGKLMFYMDDMDLHGKIIRISVGCDQQFSSSMATCQMI